MRSIQRTALALFLAACFFIATPADAALEPADVPPELQRWHGWVLHGQAQALCPFQHNDGTVIRCHWPTQLELEIEEQTGHFEQRWQIFAQAWVALPGGGQSWPDAVSVNGVSVPVVDRNGVPAIALPPGEHRVLGHFSWVQRPETIAVPPELGLLTLTLDGRKVPEPTIDAQGRLWLHKNDAGSAGQDHLETHIFRLIDDSVPMRITTLLRLTVAGADRETLFDGVLPATAIPMDLESRLPARIDGDGRLRVQTRAGQWEVRIDARLPGPVRKLAPSADYGEEIWSFRAENDLRLVQIEGAPPVAPAQTEMPDEWRTWPAYLLTPGSAMEFKEIRRGDPQPPADRLSLERRLWLDFDGNGFTINDRISGLLSRNWRLVTKAPMELGRVAIDGQDQVITRMTEDGPAGVELRNGRLALAADARLPIGSGALAVAGWNNDFAMVAAQLNLPPGWRLLATTGVDQVSQSWIQQWSLLDFFIVLIIALTMAKLRGRRWGLVALAAMALSYHEPGAPRLVWLPLLAALALWPRLPAGRLKKLTALWTAAAAIALLVGALPFVINQIRGGLFPQLEQHAAHIAPIAYRHRGAEPLGMAAPALESMSVAPKAAGVDDLTELKRRRYDPDAVITTGPGLPAWQWHSIDLRWNGPVAEDQTLRLFILSPSANLLLALVRVIVLIAWLYSLTDWRAVWRRIQTSAGAPTVTAILFGLAVFTPAAQARAADAFPPPALLEEYRQLLLEKPDCLPYCADLSRLDLTLNAEVLQLTLKINAAGRVAVPLPVDRKSWQPEQIVLDNAPIAGLLRDAGGQLWACIPSGLHTVSLSKNVEQEGLIQIPLPLRPHIASIAAPGWEIKGMQADGRTAANLYLTRLQQENRDRQTPPPLPVFMEIERRLRLDLTWQVETVVRRLTPPGTPIVVSFPLLPGESLITAGIDVDQERALINLAGEQAALTFQSNLAITPRLVLNAPRNVPWYENWSLEPGPLWHCVYEGIAPIRHQDASGRRRLQWRPWPGESVTIAVTRPAGVAGATSTIDQAALVVKPGSRTVTADLALKIRSSQGTQHTVQIPDNANLQSVTVDDYELAIRQDGAFVTIPLSPGDRRVALQWHQPTGFSALFRAPTAQLGAPAVNTQVKIQMPDKRWILLVGGPRWGPAVLFWSYLVAIGLAALVLDRLKLAPPKIWQWLLLGLGLTQIPAFIALIIVGWLLVMGIRQRRDGPTHRLAFDGLQIGLALWTLAALIGLFLAVRAGLVGDPDMQIQGNSSSTWMLNWTQDRVSGRTPSAWVFSLPLGLYRILMLAWALWLAWTLLGWLRWSWAGYTREGLWRPLWRRRRVTQSGHGG